jgi:hypothetical protein
MGIHCMRMLDFYCCPEMSMDEAGVEQARTAPFRNDPFCPWSEIGHGIDEKPWNVSKHDFLTSQAILVTADEHRQCSAEMLMEDIEEKARSRKRHD